MSCFRKVALSISLLILTRHDNQARASTEKGSGLSYRIYDNAALYGPPIESGITSSPWLSLEAEASLSGELFGTITFLESARYKFDCLFSDTSTGWVWVDGHLVCADGNVYRPFNNEYDNPLPVRKSNTTLAFRAHITSNRTTQGLAVPSLQVHWGRINMAVSADNASPLLERRLLKVNTDAVEVKYPALHPFLPEAERQRDVLQRQLSQGWGSWLRTDLQSVVKLPDGAVLTIQLCQRSTDSCLVRAVPDDNSARVGLHAHDRSYVGFHVVYKTANVSMEYTVDDTSNQLQLLVTPVSCQVPSHNDVETGDNDCSDYEIRISGRYAWFRPGTVNALSNDTLSFDPPGLESFIVKFLHPSADGKNKEMDKAITEPIVLEENSNTDAFVRIPFQKMIPVGFFTQDTKDQHDQHAKEPEPTIPSIQHTLREKKQTELSCLASKFGESKAALAQAIQAAVMWTLIYNPVENNALLMPVSRSPAWNFDQYSGAVNTDWTYTIFDWDNLFASLLAGLDPRGKLIAYSNLFQAVKSKTAAGFIPNWSTGGAKSQDRTEPPVGAKVMLEIYRKYKEAWPIEVVFDDLLDWNDWFMSKRILQPSELIALGSFDEQSQHRQTQVSNLGETQNSMQAARFESGLDNSPMYDGNFFDNKTTHMMQLYDVGMTSMVAQEAYSLAELAEIIGRDPKLSEMLRARGDDLKKKIRATLWDNDQGTFANRFPNGTFSRRISPTSFYPLMIKAASSKQSTSMVRSWLFNSSRFCLTRNGDFAGNDPHHCYWGLPSISSDDPTYLSSKFVYWRGYIWGPMSQLVYWSLQSKSTLSTNRSISGRTTHDDIQTQARKALCKQMQSLMMSQWMQNRHICENYHPHKNATECSGTRFYHWGALNGLIGMVEDGYWED